MEKIGLYGGTFGPPHLGHVYAAKTFLREVAPDRLLIMPAGIPPHKEKAAGDTPELRLAMCRAAFGDLPHTEISDYEIRKPGKSYTVETLEHLAAPGREITMLCCVSGKGKRHGDGDPGNGGTIPGHLSREDRASDRGAAYPLLVRDPGKTARRCGYDAVSAAGSCGNLSA